MREKKLFVTKKNQNMWNHYKSTCQKWNSLFEPKRLIEYPFRYIDARRELSSLPNLFFWVQMYANNCWTSFSFSVFQFFFVAHVDFTSGQERSHFSFMFIILTTQSINQVSVCNINAQMFSKEKHIFSWFYFSKKIPLKKDYSKPFFSKHRKMAGKIKHGTQSVHHVNPSNVKQKSFEIRRLDVDSSVFSYVSILPPG